jgi:hypothetical protein
MSGDWRSTATTTAQLSTLKPVSGGVADVAEHVLGDLAELGLAVAGDFTRHDHHARLDQRFAGDAAVGILGEQRVDDGVGDLVADLVGVTLVHRLGRENVILEHGGGP